MCFVYVHKCAITRYVIQHTTNSTAAHRLMLLPIQAFCSVPILKQNGVYTYVAVTVGFKVLMQHRDSAWRNVASQFMPM